MRIYQGAKAIWQVDDTDGTHVTFIGPDAERRAREFVERETDAKVKEPANKWRTPWRVFVKDRYEVPVILDCDGNIVASCKSTLDRIVRAVNFLDVAEEVDWQHIEEILASHGYKPEGSLAAKAILKLRAALEAPCPAK